jgi:hypothetical protein
LNSSLAEIVAHAEIAAAFGKSPEAFEELLPSLYDIGFPQPASDSESHWHVSDLLEWISSQQDFNATFVRHLERWLGVIAH